MKRHLCGTHAVLEALRARPSDIAVLYVLDASPKGAVGEVVRAALDRRVAIETTTPAALDALAGALRHQGVVAVSAGDYPYLDLDTLLDAVADPARGLLVALDAITDPHNFGAIVRSAVALGADGVITLRDRAAPVTGTVVRSSAGATEHARIARVTNLAQTLARLSDAGWSCVGLAGEADTALDAVDLTGPTVLVVGSEGDGLRRLVRQRCDALARIPLAGPVASLNASVAAGVALYEVVRQRLARGAA